jgi:hypothetical protein
MDVYGAVSMTRDLIVVAVLALLQPEHDDSIQTSVVRIFFFTPSFTHPHFSLTPIDTLYMD